MSARSRRGREIPPYVLDHIFFSSGLRAVAHQVCPTLASDHHALVAEFEFAE